MPTDLTEVDEFTSMIVVPNPGEARTAASVRAPLQGLTNRTRHLFKRLSDFAGALHEWTGPHAFQNTVGFFNQTVLGAGRELLYGDNAGVPSTRTRTVLIPHTAFACEVLPGSPAAVPIVYPYASWRYVPGFEVGLGFGWMPMVNDKKLVGVFRVPSGARLTRVTAQVSVGPNNPGGGDPPSVRMGAGVQNAVGNTWLDGPETRAGQQTHEIAIDIAAFYGSSGNPPVLSGDAHLGYVEFVGAGVIHGVSVHSVTATFTDPGPRNF